jgi:hypothetical protein
MEVTSAGGSERSVGVEVARVEVEVAAPVEVSQYSRVPLPLIVSSLPMAAQDLVKKQLVTGITLSDSITSNDVTCKVCEKAKATRKPIKKVRELPRATKLGERVYSDVWGPAQIRSLGGKDYMVTWIDDATRYQNLDLMRLKSEAFKFYQYYEAWLSTQHKAKIKILHTDRGGEYVGGEFSDHLASKAPYVKWHRTIPQNTTESLNGLIGLSQRRSAPCSRLQDFHRSYGEKLHTMLYG